jgi:hypothetical protein
VPVRELASDEQASRSLSDRSNCGGLARLLLTSSSRSGEMPSPRSSISMAKPLPTTSPWMRTGVFGGEKTVAFSASSAIRWMTSATAWPATADRVRESTLILV